PEVARGNIRVDGRLLTAVRVAENHGGVVRVVLDVNGVKDYSASLTSNPPQLLIDLYGNLPGARIHAAKGKPGQETALEDAHEGAPQPTRDGQSTLTRALGLKVGRIVIDAGHGGHDTGTIGPTGLMEKDLCLDVALRLGKIIEQRLPGADVVYTRSDDSFIPL